MQLDPPIPFFTLGSLHFGLHLVDGTVRTINRVQTHWQATSRPQISSMEVVAAVSSVAGFASLVEQSLNGLNKLYEFVSDCRNASRTVTRFRDELTTLRQTIEEVEALVLQIKDPFEDSRHCTFNSLTFHLENCLTIYTSGSKRLRNPMSLMDPITRNSFQAYWLLSGVRILKTSSNKYFLIDKQYL